MIFLFQFHLNVRVAGGSSSAVKLLDPVPGGEGGGQQLGEDQVDLGDQTDGATGSSSARLAWQAGLLSRVWGRWWSSVLCTAVGCTLHF